MPPVDDPRHRATQTRNPWRQLPRGEPYVLPDDQPHVDAFNKLATEAAGLDLRYPPEPFIGNLNAPVVLLSLNPGLSDDDWANSSTSARRAAIWTNLTEAEDRTFYPLSDDFNDTPVGRWWRRCFAGLIELGISEDQLRSHVLNVEFHGYHSRSFSRLPITLPSQWYSFALVEEAMNRGATIVILRGRREWLVALHMLNSYDHLVYLRNPRRATISPGNCDNFAQIVAALQAHS